MTREEAKEECLRLSPSERLNIIDEIYDAFESRTCDNCKHNLKNTHGGSRGCVQVEIESRDMRNGFGSNRFKRIKYE